MFMQIKCTNSKLKQSELAKEMKMSTSTKQRCRRERIMLSPYRISPNTNYTRKEKTPNKNLDDVKLTSNDLQMTSNEPVENEKNIY